MTGRIVVVGLGPGGADHVTVETLAAIERIPDRFLRTARHPSASLVPAPDDVRRSVRRGRHVRRRLRGDHRPAHRRRARARRDPLRRARLAARARTDRALPAGTMRRRPRPASSSRSCRPCRSSTSPTPGSASIRSRPASASSTATTSRPRPPANAARCSSPTRTPTGCCRTSSSPSTAPPATNRSSILQALGTPDERIVDTTWAELDRTVEADHLTSIWIPELATPVGAEYVRFHQLARTLREQCPWDIEQTHESLDPVPPRGDLRGRRRAPSARPRRPDDRRRPDRGARRPPVPDRVPRHDRRAGGSVHDRRRRGGRARQAGAPASPRVRTRR